MKKKLLTTALVLSLLTFGLAGCQNDTTTADTQNETTDSEVVTLQICGGCEQEKECGTYTVDGVDYIVCDDCYDEFAHGMGLE